MAKIKITRFPHTPHDPGDVEVIDAPGPCYLSLVNAVRDHVAPLKVAAVWDWRKKTGDFWVAVAVGGLEPVTTRRKTRCRRQ